MDSPRYIVVGADGTRSAPIPWRELYDRVGCGEIDPETQILDLLDHRTMAARQHPALAVVYRRLAKEQRKAGRRRTGWRHVVAAPALPESPESSESPTHVPLESEGAYAGQHEQAVMEFPWPTLNPLTVKIGSGVLVLFVLWCIFGIPVQDKVTLAEYNAVYPGMTYRKCVDVIGCEGKETVRPDMVHVRDRLVEWRNLDGSVAILQFEDDRLIIKSQERLR